jgi:hypothetical protein
MHIPSGMPPFAPDPSQCSSPPTNLIQTILTCDLGWWHLVVNLSESIAVTQNFVPPAHLQSVLRFLRDKQDQISGFSDGVDACTLFRERLKVEYPDLLELTDEQIQRKERTKTTKKRKWVEESESSGFSFNFFGS